MNASTPYVATGSWVAPDWGRELQNWANDREWMEVEREAWNVVKSNLKGVVIRSVGADNNTFGVYTNKLGLMLRKPKADQKTRRMINFVN